MIRLVFYTFVFCGFLSSAAFSQGLSMHGNPKYGTETSTHLEYANPDAPKGGHLKQSVIGTFDTLNPYTIKGKAAIGLNLFYDRLMQRVWDEPFALYPLIAKSYDIADDRSWISFTIDPDARFHDGSAITVSDVKFSYETLRIDGRPNMRQIYALVDTVKIEGNTITFYFTDGYDRETAMIIAMMPILSETYWHNKTFDETTLDPPISSGPYTIERVDVGHSITYKRDPDYWAKDKFFNVGHYNFDQITYDYYRDDTVAFEAFAKGVLNVRMETDSNRWRTGYERFDDGTIVKEPITHQRTEKTRGIILNTRRAPLNNIDIRKALSYLFDGERMNTLLYNEERKRIDSYFPNSDLSANQPAVPFEMRQSMRAAKVLIEKAGWVIENGVYKKDGRSLSFELLTQNATDEKIALYYKQSLSRMGITLRVRSLDSAAFTDRLRHYDYDMVVHHWLSSLSPGTEQTLYWGCAAKEQNGRFNFAGICDDRIDTLAANMAQAETRDDLLNTAHELDRLLLEGHYMIPLFYAGADYYAYRKPIDIPSSTPIYGAVIETWWMDDEE